MPPGETGSEKLILPASSQSPMAVRSPRPDFEGSEVTRLSGIRRQERSVDG
jgi:hypothetical protein